MRPKVFLASLAFDRGTYPSFRLYLAGAKRFFRKHRPCRGHRKPNQQFGDQGSARPGEGVCFWGYCIPGHR